MMTCKPFILVIVAVLLAGLALAGAVRAWDELEFDKGMDEGTLALLYRDYDRAINYYTKELEINPRSADIYYNRGKAYFHNGQYDQAIADFTKVLELNPRKGRIYSWRALAYYRKKSYDKAWEEVRKAQSRGERVDPEIIEVLRRASGREK